jgi:nucleoside-diphosphate-sugar epimerase
MKKLESQVALVTGATGSVCMNLCERLLEEGRRVVMYARHPLSAEACAEMAKKPGEMIFLQGDVLDAEKLEDVVREYDITQVYHGAAITPNEEMEREQGTLIIEINCVGIMNALNAARRANVNRFIYLGSLSGYGTTAFEGKPLIEGVSIPKPNSLYELSKFTAERIVLRYRQLYTMNAYVARIGDVFGPWEHYSGVRPYMSFPFQTTFHAMKGEPVYLPRPCKLDWVYSKDVANSLALLMDATILKYDVYPVCSGYVWPLTDWCTLLQKRYKNFKFGVDAEKATIKVNQSADNATMSVDRLVEDTGYVPRYDLSKSFEDYMAWLDTHEGYMEQRTAI